MPAIDYDLAQTSLHERFEEAELLFLKGKTKDYDLGVSSHVENMFSSTTQAYREVLLGCVLARMQDQNINIRLPYISLGENAFSGRSLDERVVNPLLQEKGVPSSRGPYLSVFRRSVRFEPRPGLKDKVGYNSLLETLGHIESFEEKSEFEEFLLFLCYQFVVLRESASVRLSKIHRISVEQYETILDRLLKLPSGGLLPMLVVVAVLETIKSCYKLNWTIDSQGINVSDKASGTVGDITVSENGTTILAIEVTERPIDRPRIVATFKTKIAPSGTEEYLFFITSSSPTDEARATARQYFGQGHEISFVVTKIWAVNILATLGSNCRAIFTNELIRLLDRNEVSSAIKTAWNDLMHNLV